MDKQLRVGVLFEKDLPVGADCVVTALRGDGLGKFYVRAQPPVDACNPGGATALSVLFSERPRFDRDRELPIIPEKPVIVAEFVCPVSVESAARSIFLDMDEIVNPIPVDVITGKERESVLCNRKLCDKENALVLSPRLTLPADREGRLVIRSGLLSETGFSTTENQTYAFVVRPTFSAQFYCDETYADGSCNPYLPIYLGFTEQPELSYYNRPQLKNTSTEQMIQPKQHQAEQKRSVWILL